MINPKQVSYEEFPASKAFTEDMQILPVKSNHRQVCYANDVRYITRSGMDLHLQILFPTPADPPDVRYPCIAFIQGSAWMKQNVYRNVPQLAGFCTRGYIAAMVEYRPSAVAPFPAQLQDTKTAIRFLRKNAGEYGIDPENMFVWGDSSGGHTALMAGVTREMAELDTPDYAGFPADVNGVIDYYGPTDITTMNEAPSTMDHIQPESPEGQLIGGLNVLENRKKSQATNPINYLSPHKEIPPILIIHGNKDRLVPFEQSVLLDRALKANGKTKLFYQLKDADHGGPAFWSDEVLDIVDDFMKANSRANGCVDTPIP